MTVPDALADITPAEAALVRVKLAEWMASKAKERTGSGLPAEELQERVKQAEEAAFAELYGVTATDAEGDNNGAI